MATPVRSKIEFQVKKEQFEKVAGKATCVYCKIVPREAPIYQSIKGEIACSKCKKSKAFHRSLILEELLLSLPTACKFKSNGCQIVQCPENIGYHEEECELRNVLCPLKFCEVMYPASTLTKHLKSAHKFDVFREAFWKIRPDDCFRLDLNVQENHFSTKPGRWSYPFKEFEKMFLFHFEYDPKKNGSLIWVRMFGSRSEAKNYNYKIMVEHMKVGKIMYEGPVKSLDDRKDEVFDSYPGLMINPAVVKKFVDENFPIKVEIINLKDAQLSK